MSTGALNSRKTNWLPASPFGSIAFRGSSVAATIGLLERTLFCRSASERIEMISLVGLPSASGFAIWYGTMTPNPFDIWTRSMVEPDPPELEEPPHADRSRAERPQRASGDQ